MATKNIFQTDIPRRNQTCALGQESFLPEMEYHSILVEDDGTIKRLDYCLNCWDKSNLANAKSHWKSKVTSKKELSNIPVDRDEHALILLKEAVLQNSSEANAEAFILALYLHRKKILYLRNEMNKKIGEPVILYEVAETEEIIPVKKISLSEIEIGKMQKEIATKLKKSLNQVKE